MTWVVVGAPTPFGDAACISDIRVTAEEEGELDKRPPAKVLHFRPREERPR